MAKYTEARLWQGENIVEAPSLTFDKTRRSLQAQGGPDGRVTSVFLMPGKNGKSTPANITSDRLSYVDLDRKAVFSGKVMVKGDEFTLNADSAQVLLLPRTAGGGNEAEISWIVLWRKEIYRFSRLAERPQEASWFIPETTRNSC